MSFENYKSEILTGKMKQISNGIDFELNNQIKKPKNLIQ